MFGRKSPESDAQGAQVTEQPVQEEKKPFWESLLPVMACGAGLFSDGYINNVCFDPSSRLKLVPPSLPPKITVCMSALVCMWY